MKIDLFLQGFHLKDVLIEHLHVLSDSILLCLPSDPISRVVGNPSLECRSQINLQIHHIECHM